MRALLLKSTFVAALSLVAYSAQANTVLPVQNLTFSNYNGIAPKGIFTAVNPKYWTGGTGLISIDAPGTATQTGGGGNAYPVYGPFSNPPPGGNFIQADGNPVYESSFNQNLTGLMIGTTYDLSFWQAAGQQTTFSGATTEQWIVALGATGSSLLTNTSTSPATYYDTDSSAEINVSTLMNTPSQGVSPWNLVAMQFTATAVDQTLSFLAWGDNGNTTNLPPTVFLAGVNSPALPEPPTLALFGIALLGLGASVWRKGRKSDSVG